MCHQGSCVCVTVEEAVASEECLLIYCKPVELYNILQRRAQYNPSFLSRCLTYKVKARRRFGLRTGGGNVIFNYRDQNNVLRKTEVVREFSCPFCLMRCGSFKGLHDHLNSSHDLFMFEFWASQEYQAVNVSVKIDALRSEITSGGIDPRLQSFCYCSKPRKRKRPADPLEIARNVYPHAVESCLPTLTDERVLRGSLENTEVNGTDLQALRLIEESDCQLETNSTRCTEFVVANANNIGPSVARAQSLDDVECLQGVPLDKPSGSAPAPVPNGKSKKLPSERSDPRSSMLLHKRQFFHSHRAQPMALEQVFSDRDSEDEVDDEIADIEDRRMLDDFVDVTKDEKHLMHLWNSFVRKQRVLADGHIPWACEAFLRLHGQELVRSPALFWCWRLFSIKLWNHGLVDASTMNICSLILQNFQNDASASAKTSDP